MISEFGIATGRVKIGFCLYPCTHAEPAILEPHPQLKRVGLSSSFTRAQPRLTRAQARIGPYVCSYATGSMTVSLWIKYCAMCEEYKQACYNFQSIQYQECIRESRQQYTAVWRLAMFWLNDITLVVPVTTKTRCWVWIILSLHTCC